MMRHLVSVGGGFSSTIELPLLVVEKYGRENVDMVIACLAMESPDLWRLANVRPFPEPIPCAGKQGLWTWEGDLP